MPFQWIISSTEEEQTLVKKAVLGQSIIVILVILILPDASVALPRVEVAWMTCGSQFIHNTSQMLTNFISTMDFLQMQVRTSGFGVAMAGQGEVDPIFSLVQCYGDVISEDCSLCYAEARMLLPRCYPMTEGRLFLDGCFIRFANYSFFGEYTSPNDHTVCGNATQKDSAFQVLATRAISRAVAAAPNNSGYAWTQEEIAGTLNRPVYVLANCWKSLNDSACQRCLSNAFDSVSRCLPQSEGRALKTGCYIRYSDTFFLNIPMPENQQSRGKSRVILVAASSATAAAFSIIGMLLTVFMWRKRRIQKEGEGKLDIELFLKNNENLAPKRYKYSDLKKITNSFKDILGKGGFGSVYKGKLQDGRLVAVKLLNESKGNGEDFMNEVASISRTSHVNMVILLGFCFEGSKRALIYEFVPNGSLDKFLRNTLKDEEQLGWEILFKITFGIARGLEYLHQGCNTRILHLDIKPHNILLDKDFRPKISDFGLAKLCPDRASIISMLGTRGTVGYIAPEVFCRNFGDISHKSDVYNNFGMLVLEMVGGRKNVDVGAERSSEAYFPDWIYKQLEENADEAVDDVWYEDEGKLVKRKLTIIGLWCIQTDPKQRPSITRVVEMLEGDLESLQVPPKHYSFSPAKLQVENEISTFGSSF